MRARDDIQLSKMGRERERESERAITCL